MQRGIVSVLLAGLCATGYAAASRTELKLTAPDNIANIVPVTAKHVVVTRLKNSLPDKKVWWRPLKGQDGYLLLKGDLEQEVTHVLALTLVGAGVPASEATRIGEAAPITVAGFIRELRLDEVNVGKAKAHIVVALEVRVTGEDGRDERFVLTSNTFYGDAGPVAIDSALDHAIQEALRTLPTQPSAIRAFRP
jgi:hypothetical protein